jgi:hypothetical protein
MLHVCRAGQQRVASQQYRSAALWPHLSALDDGCLMRAEHLVEIDKTPAGAGVLNETPTGVSRVR